jgi:1,4-dihydroxy-6-naphthoate synthase
VLEGHIWLYVNRYTEDLGGCGLVAVRTMLDLAAAAGLVPPVPEGALDLPTPADPVPA